MTERAEEKAKTVMPMPKPIRGAPVAVPASPPPPDEKAPKEDRVSLVESGEEDATQGMNTFTHYADTITDALFYIIGVFDKATARINLGVGLLFLVVAGQSVLLYRFEGALADQKIDRKKNKELLVELQKLKDELVTVKTDAKETKESVAEVKEAADQKANIDIEVDETGAAKVVILPKTYKAKVTEAKKSKASKKRKSSSSFSAPPAPKPAHKVVEAPSPKAIEIPLKLPPGARVVDAPESVVQPPMAEKTPKK
jgi:hypothetical protein